MLLIKQIRLESDLEELVNGSFICGAGYKSTITINPEGKILKCQVNLNEKYNTIGYINTEAGQFNMDINKSDLWNFESINQKCKSCNLFSCCKGIGCPLKVRDPLWCSNLYEHIIRRLIALTYCCDSFTKF
ncbi:SPASM domain-containing protein [bacterium]|nr:SPASM domain-containing protein [bacterium]